MASQPALSRVFTSDTLNLDVDVNQGNLSPTADEDVSMAPVERQSVGRPCWILPEHGRDVGILLRAS